MFKLDPLFGENMILQRGKKVKIWGIGNPGYIIEGKIQDQKSMTIVDENGQWMLEFFPMDASLDEQLFLTMGDEQIQMNHVAIGEVWLAGGQSNMEFAMRYEEHLKDEMNQMPLPLIRFYDVPEIIYDEQINDFDYSDTQIWRTANEENLEWFSAVGYYFSKILHAELNVPIGIIGCNWGGTRAASWMKPTSVYQYGKEWFDDYIHLLSNIDINEYWIKQRKNPGNDRGNLFKDPIGDFFMMKTRTQEEAEAFFDHLGIHMEWKTEFMPQFIPGILYEHMLKKVVPAAIRGVLWYQGESDDEPGRQHLYKDMLMALMNDWRELWGESLPFLIVQLTGYESWLTTHCYDFPTIRQCQKEAVDATENTWLCSIGDVGTQFDIHPKNKLVVGQRLGLLAMNYVYEIPQNCDAPEFIDVRLDNDKVVMMFRHIGTGLYIEGDSINALNVFVNSQCINYRTEIHQGEVWIFMNYKHGDKIDIQFAQSNWYCINLFNSYGIPALPFKYSNLGFLF